MSTNTVPTNTRGEAPAQDLASVMRGCEPDRVALLKELEPLFRDLWGTALKEVETCLPDFRVEGSADAKLHAAIRGRVLTAGNAKLRELPGIVKNYAVRQVYERVVETRQRINTPVILPPRAAAQ